MIQVPKVNKQLVYETIEDETVLVNLQTGTYYSLVGVGSVVWNELMAGRSVDEILVSLDAEYDAPPQEIKVAIHQLLHSMTEEDILTLEERADTVPLPDAAFSNPTPIQAKHQFHAPRLAKFTDMQELLLLDPIHDMDETGWPATNDPKNA